MTDAPALDAVIDQLKRRVDRYADQGESGAVLDEAANALLAQARDLAGQGDLTPWTALVLAQFHWCRSLALPEGVEGPDEAYAIELFTALWRADPDAVPPLMRKLLEENEAVLGTACNYGGTQLFDLFERTGDCATLDNALDLLAKAVAADPADGPEQRRYQSNLVGAYLARFEVASDPTDLDIAIELGFRAAELDGGDEQVRSSALGNLGVALRTRYERANDPGDLDAAIAVVRNALTFLPSGHPDVATYLANLAIALRMRFERTHDDADLDAALGAAQRAADTAPADSDRPMCLNSLASCRLARYHRYGDISDLELAIDAYVAAVRQAPACWPGSGI